MVDWGIWPVVACGYRSGGVRRTHWAFAVAVNRCGRHLHRLHCIVQLVVIPPEGRAPGSEGFTPPAPTSPSNHRRQKKTWTWKREPTFSAFDKCRTSRSFRQETLKMNKEKKTWALAPAPKPLPSFLPFLPASKRLGEMDLGRSYLGLILVVQVMRGLQTVHVARGTIVVTHRS